MGYILYGDGWGIPNQTNDVKNHDVKANLESCGKRTMLEWEEIFKYIYENFIPHSSNVFFLPHLSS